MAYGTDIGFQAWLDEMGYVLPVSAPSLAILRARGSTYIDAIYEPLWTGHRATIDQDNAWPRIGALANCTLPIPDDFIPNAVILASYRAAYLEAVTPGILSGVVQSGPRVKRQKVDVLEREFFDDGGATAGNGGGFIDPTIDGMVRSFICTDDADGYFFATVGSSHAFT